MKTEHYINGVLQNRTHKIHLLEVTAGKAKSYCKTKAKVLSMSTAITHVDCKKCIDKIKILKLV